MYRGVIVGLVAGVLSGFSRLHLTGSIDVFVNSIGAWTLVPLFVGALTRSMRGAVLASLAQLFGFYALTGAFVSVLRVQPLQVVGDLGHGLLAGDLRHQTRHAGDRRRIGEDRPDVLLGLQPVLHLPRRAEL